WQNPRQRRRRPTCRVSIATSERWPRAPECPTPSNRRTTKSWSGKTWRVRRTIPRSPAEEIRN
ncbi:MAG: hypothetical protein AVDCRST_MAG91-1719, partial [uncultured Sphingomonadaceae bacterium]